ncbi:MAG: nuclear transport factor 2 family protein [Chryseolinea sp.]
MKMLFLTLAVTLTMNAMAQSADEKEVTSLVESMRMAMMSGDKATLEKITSDDLTYVHSSGLLEDKATFVNSIVSGKFSFVKIDFPDLTVKIIGNTAVVRHKIVGDTKNDGKPATVNIGVMLILQKQHSQWRIIARQAYKL